MADSFVIAVGGVMSKVNRSKFYDLVRQEKEYIRLGLLGGFLVKELRKFKFKSGVGLATVYFHRTLKWRIKDYV
jgi:hypothetical protein